MTRFRRFFEEDLIEGICIVAAVILANLAGKYFIVNGNEVALRFLLTIMSMIAGVIIGKGIQTWVRRWRGLGDDRKD